MLALSIGYSTSDKLQNGDIPIPTSKGLDPGASLLEFVTIIE